MCEFFVLMVVWWFKPKFHYANFADFVADTNHKSLQHKSRRRLSGFVSRTFMICVRNIVANFRRAL